MSAGMYEPDKKSRFYLYIVFFSAVSIAIAAYQNFRVFEVENQCSNIALKTSGLTRDFKIDPYSSFDYVKAQCESSVLAAKK